MSKREKYQNVEVLIALPVETAIKEEPTEQGSTDAGSVMKVEKTEEKDERPRKKRSERIRRKPGSFGCEQCEKVCMTEKNLERHLKTHEKKKSFMCHLCGKEFKHNYALQRHVRTVHENRRDFECDLCGKAFLEKSVRDDHRRIHTGECPYVCQTCGKAFKTMASLCIHRKIHTDSFPHECTFCPKRFRFKQQLLGHLTMHTGEKKHFCDICGKGFGVRWDLTRHRPIHNTSKDFVCAFCGMTFTCKKYVQRHTKCHQKESRAGKTEPGLGVPSLELGMPISVPFPVSNIIIPSVQSETNLCISDLLSILAGMKQENDEFEDEKQVLDSADLRDLFESSSEKLFRCNVCLKSYAKITSYEAHLKIHNNMRDSQVTCHICGTNFVSLQDLKAHVTVHGRNSMIYPCKICGHVFSSLAARKRHKLTHLHLSDWTCELCKRKFTQHSFYIDHMLMHKLKKEMKIFICSCCGTHFPNEAELYEHEKTHSEQDEIVFKDDDNGIEVVEGIKLEPPDEGTQMIVMPVLEEENCNGVGEEEGAGGMEVPMFKDGYAVVEVAQEETGEFICGECGKECSDMKSVNAHMKEHTQEDIYECIDCKQVFKFKQSLLQHVRTYHAGTRPYGCDVCGATFSSKNGLRSHRVIHLSLRYPCEECGIDFKGRSGLYLHKQRVHRGKKDFVCDYCGKMFSLKCQRDTHRRIHTGEKPYKCETCGVGFRAQSGLYAHRKTHTDERPYKCEVCGKRLRLPYNLRLHMRTHTGEKPYACDICGRAFSQPGDCKKHKKTHSKNIQHTVLDPIKKEDKPDFVDITYLTFDS